ncbi:MAG: 2-oxoacid:acceptor oxidoreductase subunit alpha [Candidatus Aminicenantes bacterium]|nr:2-oxoacid:acceptor oxidoreductase subunit alpha [Candidatus Aminicenantes bacterium]
MIKDISVMIAGQAGDGVLFTGNVLAKILKKEGWEVATYRYFPSNIRGEPTNYTIRASHKRVFGLGNEIDVLLSFDCASIIKYAKLMAQGGVVFCDGEELSQLKPKHKEGKTFHKLPLKILAREHFKNDIFKNMIALGALCFILDLNFRVIERIIIDAFLKRKGKEIVRMNIDALNLGCEQARLIVKHSEQHKLIKKKDSGKMFISGDEAIAVGALAAGCRFFAAYPICPATEIWQWLALQFPKFNGLVVQTEDELAAINMALGASYAGARAMTSTSGPGGSLMMESYGLSGMAEIPIVIIAVQRVGPSTGMPTKTEQSDLNQWLYGSHGEFPRIILSPGTIEECFDFTVKAFNLADKYQVPVVLLTEQDFGQNYRSVKKFDLSKIKIDRGKLLSEDKLKNIKNYKRYEFTPDGISPRALPSMKNGIHMVEGNEHDEKGYRDEDPENRIRMMQKRMHKLSGPIKDMIPPKLWGNKQAPIGLIGFGSTLGSIVEAIDELKELNIFAKNLQIRTVCPFPVEAVSDFIQSCEFVFVVENNYSGQLFDLIHSQVKPNARMHKILNYSSVAFRPVDISNQIRGTVCDA